MIVFYLLISVLILLLVSGAYVFTKACVRRKELPWLVKEEIEKTSFGKYYECMLAADKWLKDHRAQDVYITSHDGLRLHALWIPAEQAKATMLLVHGYRSTKLLDFGVAFAYYHERGFNILVPDHRTHAESQGRYITFGVKESEDILDWVVFHNHNFGMHPVFLSGLSMGAATVMYLADRQLPENVKGIIADCGFTSPKEILAVVFRKVTRLPAGAVMIATDCFARIFAGFSIYSKDSRRILQNSKIPVLLIHGTDDDFVPCHMTQDSFSACTGPKELLLVEGAGHGVSFLVDHERYSDTVEKFINDCLIDKCQKEDIKVDSIKVKKLHEKAMLPTYGSSEAAGADLYACLDASVTVLPGDTAWISTGIALEVPKGYAGLIYARSSLGVKRGLAPANKVGVVDSDYRGEIRVVLLNHGKEPQTIEHGERIAQFVITPVLTPPYEETNELSDTNRGVGGFGSTGK